jgi:protein-S-isoprenylcysteine O-methyltransferase Ste14
LSAPKVSRKARLPLGFLFALVYLLFARPDPRLLPVGLAIALAGLFVRGWAAGHIEKNSQLSVTGPYAHVRNPLYLGSFLLALGFALASHWLFVVMVLAFFILIYAPTIAQERLKMISLFPDQYPAYEAHVPMFVPRPTPWRPGPAAVSHGPARQFSLSRYMRHSEWKAALGFVAASLWLVLRLKLGL